MWPWKRRPDDVTTAERLRDIDRRLAELQETLDFDKERFERQRGQILTLQRQHTQAMRRIEEVVRMQEPYQEGDEYEEYDDDEFPDDEFPEEAYERAKREKGTKDG